MRIVVDFQGAQTDSRFRGIGKYSTDFVRALIRQSEGDEIVLALNGAFAESIEPIRAEFDGVIAQENIRVWHAPGPFENFNAEVGSLREVGQIIREYFLRSLDPDVILVTSMFEGLRDQALLTAKEYVSDIPTVSIFYDFTPLIMPDPSFQSEAMPRRWYRHRIRQLRNCDLLLAISESARQELLSHIDYPAERVVNILAGHSPEFGRQGENSATHGKLLKKLGIERQFILYVGGVEESKNLRALVEALSYLSPEMRETYQLAVAGKRGPEDIERIKAFATTPEVAGMIKAVGFVSTSDLAALYSSCALFVFPSIREGFGLPPLEAMACGAPTIVADSASLPEVVANPAALFDPRSPEAIARKIEDVLRDAGLRQDLVARGRARAAELTWDRCAQRALAAIHTRLGERRRVDGTKRAVVMRTTQFGPNKSRIMVQKLDHNGDFLLAVPAMAKLRARYPDAQIDVMVGSWNKPAALAAGLFDNVYTLDYFKAKSSDTPELASEELDALIGGLPYYDYAIDLRRVPGTRFILLRIPAEKYFGYKTGDELDRLLTNPLDLHPDDGGARSNFDETHICEQMLRIIDALPFDANDYLKLPEMAKRLERKPGAVAIFPRVGLDARQWESVRFAKVIDALASHTAVTEINLYCGRPEELEIIPYTLHPKVQLRTGLSFGELASSLSRNEVCVGNNSFGVHLAGYMGCVTIGIYSGHEIPEQWGAPFGDSYAVTVDAPCAPCHLPDRQSCPFDVYCLSDISAETIQGLVLDAIHGLLPVEEYSRINHTNPASVLKPLLDAVNKSKFKGRIDDLDTPARMQFAAALSTNFPRRENDRRRIYVDVTEACAKPGLDRDLVAWSYVNALVDKLSRDKTVDTILVAAGPRDRAFYEVSLDEFEEGVVPERRDDRIALPMAGDAYLGLDAYLRRSSFQWSLLANWRQNGVRVMFRLPATLDDQAGVEERQDGSERSKEYLCRIAIFDCIIAEESQLSALEAWAARNCAERLRPLRLVADRILAEADSHALTDFLLHSASTSGSASRAQPSVTRLTPQTEQA